MLRRPLTHFHVLSGPSEAGRVGASPTAAGEGREAALTLEPSEKRGEGTHGEEGGTRHGGQGETAVRTENTRGSRALSTLSICTETDDRSHAETGGRAQAVQQQNGLLLTTCQPRYPVPPSPAPNRRDQDGDDRRRCTVHRAAHTLHTPQRTESGSTRPQWATQC